MSSECVCVSTYSNFYIYRIIWKGNWKEFLHGEACRNKVSHTKLCHRHRVDWKIDYSITNCHFIIYPSLNIHFANEISSKMAYDRHGIIHFTKWSSDKLFFIYVPLKWNSFSWVKYLDDTSNSRSFYISQTQS